MVCHHTESPKPTAVKLKADYRFHAAAILGHILPKKKKKNNSKVRVFRRCYHTTFQDPALSDVCIVPISEIRTTTILFLLIAVN